MALDHSRFGPDITAPRVRSADAERTFAHHLYIDALVIVQVPCRMQSVCPDYSADAATSRPNVSIQIKARSSLALVLMLSGFSADIRGRVPAAKGVICCFEATLRSSVGRVRP